MAMTRPSALRREPVQERSARRVAAMLDASAEILDEVGYEGLTTTLVAERAGVAIGSVYQFFPDKRALALALGQRNLDAFIQRIRSEIAHDNLAGWWEAVEAVIDIYIDMHRSVPGFRAVQFGAGLDPTSPDQERDTTLAIAHSVSRLVVDSLGVAPAPHLDFVLANAVEVADAMFDLAFRRDPEGDPATLAEAKWLLHAYLTRHRPDDDKPAGTSRIRA